MSKERAERRLPAAATELKESLEGMSLNLEELSEAMSEVADGYAEFGSAGTTADGSVEFGNTADGSVEFGNAADDYAEFGRTADD